MSADRDQSTASTKRASTDDTTKMTVAKPDHWHGDRVKLDDWFNQLLIYFRIEKVPKEKQPLVAASYLRGDAKNGIRPRITQKLRQNHDPEGIFDDFVPFVNNIRSVYG